MCPRPSLCLLFPLAALPLHVLYVQEHKSSINGGSGGAQSRCLSSFLQPGPDHDQYQHLPVHLAPLTFCCGLIPPHLADQGSLPFSPRYLTALGDFKMQSAVSINLHLVDACTGLPDLFPGLRGRLYLMLHSLSMDSIRWHAFHAQGPGS